MREPYPTEAQWLEYYTDLAKKCGGEIPISYPRITTWRCECGTVNATVDGERRRCVNPKCNVVRINRSNR